MQLNQWEQLNNAQQEQLLKRPIQRNQQAIYDSVTDIVLAVKSKGDVALEAYTQQFDGVAINDFLVSEAEFNTAKQQIDKQYEEAIDFAIKRIKAYHQQQSIFEKQYKQENGIHCFQKYKPISRVGLYVPGGSAPLVSTVMMLAVPAKIAGSPLRVLCTPCDKDGKVNAYILATAKKCGIDKVYKVGGAQAISAMAYGTASVPKVDKIFGPGNAYVTQAKILCSQDPEGASIDMPAGPSEILVIADENANPEYIAADLLSQAEHGPDSQVILITTSISFAQQVKSAIKKQKDLLSRNPILKQSLAHSQIIFTKNILSAINISNRYAPEHLVLNTTEPEQYLDKITAAGSVFIGPYAPETFGDYVTGCNHVLPTYGYATTYSGLSVRDFMKTINFQKITREGFNYLADAAIKIAEIEKLDAHKNAVLFRKQTLEKNDD